MKKNKKNTRIYIVLVVVILLLIVLPFIFDNTNDYNQNIPGNKKETFPKEVLKLPDIDRLKKKYRNNEVVGLVYIPNTKIKEPIVQTTNNSYYLWRNIYNEQDNKGAAFLDYRNKINDDRKNIIYGHNSYTLDVPFKELEGYYKKSYYKEHKYIYLKSEKDIIKYEVFSIYIEVSDWSYTRLNFENDESWYKHLQKLKNSSWYDTGVSINKNDRVLILQTCSHHKSYTKYADKYLIIVAKRI